MRVRTGVGIIILAFVGLFVIGSARAQDDYSVDRNWPKFHDMDLRRWGEKTGLSQSTLQELLRAVGREDDTDYRFQNIDARSLKKRGQVLLSTYEFGTAHRMTVYVIDTRTPYYERIWQADGTTEFDFSTESVLGAATASVGPKGTIVVKLPVWNGRVPKSSENSVLRVAEYVWDGKTYALHSERKFLRYKWSGTDWEVLQ